MFLLLEREEWKLRNFQGELPETIFISKIVETIYKIPNKYSCYRIKDVVDTLKLNNREANQIINFY